MWTNPTHFATFAVVEQIIPEEHLLVAADDQ